MKNWFTTHKKHHKKRRLAEITESVVNNPLAGDAGDNPGEPHCNPSEVQVGDEEQFVDETITTQECVFSTKKFGRTCVQEEQFDLKLDITSAPVTSTNGNDLGERVKIHAYSYSLTVEEDVIHIDKQLRNSVEPFAIRALHQKVIHFSIPVGVGVTTQIVQEFPFVMFEVKVESLLSDYPLSRWYSWQAPFVNQVLREGLRVRVPAVFLLMHDEEGLCDKSLAVFDKSMGFQLPAHGRLDSPKIFDTTKLQFTTRSRTSSEKVNLSHHIIDNLFQSKFSNRLYRFKFDVLHV
ncbi:hypothetical protein R1sor_021874 [Riccia sorocarpa]|uniref:Uncharacterized protein n=1 Tax=Riccia sorocarpa TaxID=122646 RepID=A0ABD3GIA2_9MARC